MGFGRNSEKQIGKKERRIDRGELERKRKWDRGKLEGE